MHPSSWKLCVQEAGERALHVHVISMSTIPICNTSLAPLQGRYCRVVCRNAQHLAGHMSRIHKVKHIARKFAHPSGTCTTCLKSFHSKARFVHHLRQNSYKCLLQYGANNASLSQEEIIEFNSHDRAAAAASKRSGLSALHAQPPVVQLAGPLRPLINSCLTSMHDGTSVVNAVPQKSPRETK